MLKDRNILLGITGSIAAFKAVDIARNLVNEGATVDVVMTQAACRFISPLTFGSVTGRPVFTRPFDDPFLHINLAKQAHLLLIAPATANTINKIACGIGDNLLTTIVLAYNGMKLMAPAMNFRMYNNPIVRKNIGMLEKSGVQFIGPSGGSLACGEEGIGRMAEVHEIIEAVITALAPKDLKGHRILVTAGPTREPIDPVRFLSNRSSGRMGYEIARAARRRGAEVTLISGPSSLIPPADVKLLRIETASEMEKAISKNLKGSTAVVMAAAVSDFTPLSKAKVKLDKNDINSLKLKKTQDILKKIGSEKGGRILVGFAAEYGRNIDNARKKLKDKSLDLIVLNDISQKGAGFDVDTNIVTIIDRSGKIENYPLMKKIEVADIILDKILSLPA